MFLSIILVSFYYHSLKRLLRVKILRRVGLPIIFSIASILPPLRKNINLDEALSHHLVEGVDQGHQADEVEGYADNEEVEDPVVCLAEHLCLHLLHDM